MGSDTEEKSVTDRDTTEESVTDRLTTRESVTDKDTDRDTHTDINTELLLVGDGQERTAELLTSLLNITTKSPSPSFPEEESEAGLTCSTLLLPTETAADGLTESQVSGSTTGLPDSTSEMVTANPVTTVSTHQTKCHGTESLT